MTERLTQKTVDEIAGALHRLKELNTKTIKESTDAGEARGLAAFIHTRMNDHAEEFIANWITVQNEYRPLIQGFTGLMRHGFALISREESARQQQPPEAVKSSPKVVQDGSVEM